MSSTVLAVEVSRNPDPDRRRDAEALLLFANEVVVPNSGEGDRWPVPKRVARRYSSPRTTDCCVMPDEIPD